MDNALMRVNPLFMFVDNYHQLLIRIPGRRVYRWKMPPKLGDACARLHRIKQYGIKRGMESPWK